MPLFLFIQFKANSMEQMILVAMSKDEFFAALTLVVKNVIDGKDKGEKKEALLSPEEARKVWQPAISKVTLHRWTKEGLVPSHRIGGRVYYKHSELVGAVKEIRPYDHTKYDVRA